MTILFFLLRLCVGGCRHRHTYRERRPLYGAQVLHLVCEDCGHAVPAMQRTAREHRRAVKAGAVRPAQVHRAAGDLIAIRPRGPEHRKAS